MEKYVIISYASCIAAVVAFAAYACARYTFYMLKNRHDQTAEEFITARGTQGTLRIMFSFFASVVGAWCLVSPSQFAYYTGILGLGMYAFASGIPVLIVSLFGPSIQARFPDVCSIGDFAGKRFGPVFRTLVVLVCLFNMSIGMLAEYTTMGALFKDFVGSLDYPIVIVVGVLTMIYTAYGGLYISILTDQVQAFLSIGFISTLTIFVATTFRESLPTPLTEELGVNKYGYSAIFSMPCSLLAATVFSEAIWQKVWASANRRTVVTAGLGASVLIMIAVFIFGFGGFLAAWGGLISYDTNPNLYLFQVFKTADADDLANSGVPARVRSWVGVLALVLAVTMNTSAVDSLQSGITGTLSAHFFKDQHVSFTRLVLVLINIPLMVVSLQGYPILSLFLISNMLSTCCFLPVLAGVFSCTRKFVTESAAICGCVTAILTTCAYGAGRWYNETEKRPKVFGEPGEPITSHAEGIKYGIYYAWYDNVNYDWHYFLAAALSSVAGTVVWGTLALLIEKCTGWTGPNISDRLRRLPVFKFLLGDGVGVDLLKVVTCGRHQYQPTQDLEASPSRPVTKEELELAMSDNALATEESDSPTAPPLESSVPDTPNRFNKYHL